VPVPPPSRATAPSQAAVSSRRASLPAPEPLQSTFLRCYVPPNTGRRAVGFPIPIPLAAAAFDYGLYDLSPAAQAVVVPMPERVRGLIARVWPATI